MSAAASAMLAFRVACEARLSYGARPASKLASSRYVAVYYLLIRGLHDGLGADTAARKSGEHLALWRLRPGRGIFAISASPTGRQTARRSLLIAGL